MEGGDGCVIYVLYTIYYMNDIFCYQSFYINLLISFNNGDNELVEMSSVVIRTYRPT